jgi:hypothetical protein
LVQVPVETVALAEFRSFQSMVLPGQLEKRTYNDCPSSAVNRYSSIAAFDSRFPAPVPGLPFETVAGTVTSNTCGGTRFRCSATLSIPNPWLASPSTLVADHTAST